MYCSQKLINTVEISVMLGHVEVQREVRHTLRMEHECIHIFKWGEDTVRTMVF